MAQINRAPFQHHASPCPVLFIAVHHNKLTCLLIVTISSLLTTKTAYYNHYFIIKMATEDLRIFSCDLIQNTGILLNLPQMVMTTAQMLLQKLYHRPDCNFDSYPIETTAIASLLLASKIEDNPRESREVFEAFICVISEKLRKDYDKKYVLKFWEHDKVKKDVILAERGILRDLGFNIISSYPHKIIVTIYNALVNVLDEHRNVWTEAVNQEVLQEAWNYCNDSLRTEAFIKFSQEAIACACIQLACAHRKPFPKSTDGREWYCLFSKNGDEVESAMRMLENSYSRTPINPQELKPHLHLFRRLETRPIT